MEPYQAVFQRHEVKYLLTCQQYRVLRHALAGNVQPAAYPRSTIWNLYYDTPDFRLIRASMEKPAYKEKLRLRSYQLPAGDSPAYVEIKKKFDGIVYKRRQQMPYNMAKVFLDGESTSCGQGQIVRELEWFLHLHAPLAPAMFIYYDRLSLCGKEDGQLRLTFDANLRWRAWALDFQEGAQGVPLLKPGQVLLEVKAAHAMPVWLADMLAACKAYPGSFSKYGAAYRAMRYPEEKGVYHIA